MQVLYYLHYMKYRAIGFDYGGVINGEPGFVFTKKFCELVGITEKEYKEVYFRHNRAFNAGKPISERELWQRVLRDLHKEGLLEAVLQFVSEYRTKRSINQPVLDLVDTLRKAGYKSALLSNNSVEAADKMRDQKIDSHFDVFIISAEVGLMKPDPAIYELLCQKLNVLPKELAFIDDSKTSLGSADQVGFTPILFTNYQDLLDQLKNLGVL